MIPDPVKSHTTVTFRFADYRLCISQPKPLFGPVMATKSAIVTKLLTKFLEIRWPFLFITVILNHRFTVGLILG